MNLEAQIGTWQHSAFDPDIAKIIRHLSPAERRRLLSGITTYSVPQSVPKKKESIFISHSSADLRKLVEPAARRIRAAGFEPYVASLRVTGKNPAEKIVGAISSSRALFAIITRHVTNDRDTRDWVLFEIGAAKSLNKPVFGWKTPEAKIPEPVKQITDYFTFDPKNREAVRQTHQDAWTKAGQSESPKVWPARRSRVHRPPMPVI